MTRICIIGVSGYGRIHYELLMDAVAAGHADVIGATIINPDEELDKCVNLQRLGCRIYDDYKVMLDELAGKADLCMIPTGTPLHRPMTIAALEAGMHVLVEKPAAGCIEDVRLMQAAAERTGRLVAVGYQHLYTDMAMAIKRRLLASAIGTVESLKCLVMWPRDHAYYQRNGWAGKLSVEGAVVNDSPFNNAVAHELMMMLFLAGNTERKAAVPVSVSAELLRANAIESADTACMRIETAEGIPIEFYATHACEELFDPEVHVTGSKGTIKLTHNRARVMADGAEPVQVASGSRSLGRSEMLRAVLDAVQEKDGFYCDLEMASRQTAVVSMIHAHCPIQTVKGETITTGNASPRTFIPGVERLLRKAFENNQTGILIGK